LADPLFDVRSILSDAECRHEAGVLCPRGIIPSVGLASAPGLLPAGAISRIGARGDRCSHYRFDMTVRHQEIRPVTMAPCRLIDAARIGGITQVSSVI